MTYALLWKFLRNIFAANTVNPSKRLFSTKQIVSPIFNSFGEPTKTTNVVDILLRVI